MVNPEHVGMPSYLLVGIIANTFWLHRTVTDMRAEETTSPNAIMSLGLSISSFVWVLFCFVQCFLLLLSGHNGAWWDVMTDEGCALMGAYSVFSGVSSQLLITCIAYVSHAQSVRRAPVTAQTAKKICAACILGSVVLAVLPLFGAGGQYAYSGEGFCYGNWSSGWHVLFMEIVTVPALCLAPFWFVKLSMQSSVAPHTTAESAVMSKSMWLVLAATFVATWVLWVPAAFIGLLSSEPYPDMFPTGYMIAAGVLGHSQPLVNVYLYGVVWRNAYVKGLRDDGNPTKDVELGEQKTNTKLVG